MAKAQTITFRAPVKHGTLQFFPGVPVAFEDADAAPYFIAAGFADPSKGEPVHTYPKSSIDIDPETVFGSGDRVGQKVMSNG